MKSEIFVTVVIFFACIALALAYTADPYDNIQSILNNSYTAESYDNIILILEELRPEITASATSPGIVYISTDFKFNMTATDQDNATFTGYVQFYVNNTASGSMQNQTISNNTNTLIGTLSNSSFNKGAKLIAEFWAGDGIENTTKENTTEETAYDREEIDCSNMDDYVPIVINGSNGFAIDGEKQIVWTYCSGASNYLYYNNYSDYLVANSTTQLPHEVEFGNGTSYNPTSVWNSNYKMVQHLQEDPSGSAPQVIDSTTNLNNGTSGGTMTSGDQITGKIDGSLDFDGSDDYVNVTVDNTISDTFTDENSIAIKTNLSVNTTLGQVKLTNVVATGGTITYDGNYKIHTFTSNGTFTIDGNMDVEVLVVAGGGGGGTDWAGGGGAGGYRYIASHAVTAQEYPITVGAGGSADTNGSNSVFDSITSIGGGAGGVAGEGGDSGGSGGGAGLDSSSGGGNGTVGQGHDGGNCSPNSGAGGGGGATANGADGVNMTSGDGGAGTPSEISGGSVTYAGGGGGGGYIGNSAPAGSGGEGGGGGGGYTSGSTGTAGTANTGGGGGGGAGGAGAGGAGGSGIVIIRYLISYRSSGELWSTNLLSGQSVSSIDSFGYNASSIPAGTNLTVQFSQDNSTWKNSTGTTDGWDSLSSGANTIDLSSLSWSGANLYYKMKFGSNGTSTPVLDDMNVTYNNSLDITDEITIEAWFNATQLGASQQNTISDTFTDENNIAIKTNLSVNTTAGQVKLTKVVATGGTITYDGDYKIHTFTSNGTFTVVGGNITVEYLVVAGGGAGGGEVSNGASGGGGGAGGVLTGSIGVTPKTYSIVVGDGGDGYYGRQAIPETAYGGNSSFSTIECIGGGGGSCYGYAGGNGGSGGGAGGEQDASGGKGTDGQGYNGGDGFVTGLDASGNGGGASEIGITTTEGATHGGDGIVNTIYDGSNITYGGGGGGGAEPSGALAGSGGDGGGGAGGTLASHTGTSATANTGGGGGGRGQGVGTELSGNGGSGIVIIRYLISYKSSGELWSTNLLSGQSVSSIDSFGYNASSIPAGTNLTVQFSQDNSTWKNSTGTTDGWNSLSSGANIIDLSSLSWSGANFYYKIKFSSNGTNTSVMDGINVTYTSSNLSSVIISKQNAYELKTNSASLIGVINNGTSQEVSYSVSAGQWYNSVLTYNGSLMRLYLDGTEVANKSVTGSINTNSNDLFIGSLNTSSDYFNGTIDSVRISNTSRSASYINQTYQNTLRTDGYGEINTPPAQPGLTYPANNSYINSITMNWTGSDAESDTVYYYVLVNGTQACYTADLNCSYDPSDGYYQWNVTPYDGTVNGTVSSLRYYTYDTTNPQLTITTSNNTASNTLTTIEGTASDINNDSIYANNTAWTWNNTYTNWKFTNNTNVAEGTHHILITANDSAGNTNSSLFVFTYDTTAPIYSDIGKNDTTIKVNDIVLFYANWSDSLAGLSHHIFSWNNSGSWENDSAVSLTDWSNITKTITATGKPEINWKIYANDSANNWNNTGTQTFNITNTAPTFDIPLVAQSTNSGTPFTYDINASDIDLDTIIYYDNTSLFNIDSSTGIITDTPTESEKGTYTILITIGDGTANTTSTFGYTITDATSPTISNFQFIAVNSSMGQIGTDETAFNFSNLEDIEYMNITFTLSDVNGISGDTKLYLTANGTNACSLGNNQSAACYNFDSGTWIEYQNNTDTSTFRDIGGSAQGDSITCTYTENSTARNYTCEIDEHYNPNVWKHYPLNFSDMKWQDGPSERIKKNVVWRIELDTSNIPLDADYCKLEFRVNSTILLTPLQQILAYMCNSTYSTGDPSINSNCQLVAGKLPADLQDDGTKFRAIFTSNLTNNLGDIKYVLITSDSPTSRCYAMKTYGFLGSASVRSSISTDNGDSYNLLADGYETELNINWFYNGTNSNITQTLIKVFSNDSLSNSGNSSIEVMTWEATSLNEPPIVDIIVPQIDDFLSGTEYINYTTAEPNGDRYTTNITVTNSTTTTSVAADLSDSTSTYNFNTTTVSDGEYNLTVESCENTTSDLLCGSDTHNITIDNTNPDLSITTSNNTYHNTLTIEGTASDTNNDSIYANNTAWTWNNTYASWKFTNNTNIADGLYHILITANDSAGNTQSSLFAFTYDSTPPVLNFTSPTEANQTTATRNWTQANITIDEEKLDTLRFSWNSTNYTFYDDLLVLALNFNNNSAIGENSTYAIDISAYGNNGTAENNAHPVTSGKFSGAYEFDGINDYVNVSDSASLNLTVLSIGFWFKPEEEYNSSTDYISFVYHDDYEVFIDNGSMVFNYQNNNISSSTTSWNKDQWYHVSATYDGSTQALYVNGLSESNASVSSPFSIKNNNGENTASFFSSGDIILKGSCSAGSCSYPGDDAFIIQNPSGETVAYINSTGDLCIEDSNCNDNDASCNNPGDGSFIIKDSDDAMVSYINATGHLCLIGELTENGSP